ncbi:MAG: DUF4411 family protein [Rhodospirillaceae bacterium]|nr:DUF4411 family protein [Rhodospirillaceae bacterium]MYI49031.1 DUF4411 family protein [Rhodospirillaceae bacterium]
MYVFDTSTFTQLFRSYYPDRFPTLWQHFDRLVDAGNVTSTREVRREIEDGPVRALTEWAGRNTDLFPAPTSDEARFVSRIFQVTRFQQVIEQRKLLKGGKNADPFLIARAQTISGMVVTMESEPPNGVKIPNICRHFGINCTSLEGFMEREDWQF